MFKFLIYTIVLSAFFISGLYFFLALGWLREKPSMFYTTLIFIVFVTNVIFAYLYNQTSPSSFTGLYLLSLVVKLIAFLAYNYFMIMKNKAAAWADVSFFLICYMSFTILEISFLYRRINDRI